MMIARFTCNERTLDLASAPYSVMGDFLPPPATWNRIYTSPISDIGGELVLETAANRQFSFNVRILANGLESIESAVQRLSSFVKLYRSGDLYFEFRAGSLPEPLWGQFGAPYRYQVVDADAAVGSEYASRKLRTAGISVTVTLTVKPLTLGAKQRLASAAGGVWMDNLGAVDGSAWGVRMGEATTNKMTNPVFGNSTWSSGWTFGASLIYEQNTDPAHCLFAGSSAKVVQTGVNSFYQTINVGNTNAHVFSFYVKKPDSSAVSAADVTFTYSTAKTLAFTDVGNGWYRAVSASFAGINANTNTSVSPGAGRTLFFDGFQLEEKSYATPISYGDMLGCAWSGTAHASTSTRVAGYIAAPITADTFSIGAGAIALALKFDYDNTFGTIETLFDTRDAGHAASLRAYFSNADDKFYLTDGSNTISTAAQAFSAFSVISLVFVWGPSGLAIYKNGSTTPAASGGTYTIPSAGVDLFFGTNYGAGAPFLGIVQGATVYDRELSATQAGAIGTAALLVAAGGCVDAIPCLWTKDGDDVVDNYDDDTHDNFAVALGIPGSLPADTDFLLTADGSSWGVTLWLGNHVDRGGFWRSPSTNFYYEAGGTAEAGNSNNDYYLIDHTLPIVKSASVAPASPSDISGPVYAFIRARSAAGTQTLETTPVWYNNTGAVDGPVNNFSMDTTYRVWYAGELLVHASDLIARDKYTLTLRTVFDEGTNDFRLDFAMWICGPMAVITPVQYTGKASYLALALPSSLSLHGEEVSFNPNSSSVHYYPSRNGDIIELIPGAYNTLQSIIGTKAAAWTNTRTMTYTKIVIAPRWSLL